MFQIAGGALGLGLTTSIFTSASEDELAEKASAAGLSLTDHQDSVAHGVLAGTDSGREVVADFSGEAAERLLEAVRDSFVSGLQVSFRVVAAIAAVGFVIALLNIGGRLRRKRSRPA